MAILDPTLAIFTTASRFVSIATMDKENCEVNRVVVRNDMSETWKKENKVQSGIQIKNTIVFAYKDTGLTLQLCINSRAITTSGQFTISYTNEVHTIDIMNKLHRHA